MRTEDSLPMPIRRRRTWLEHHTGTDLIAEHGMPYVRWGGQAARAAGVEVVDLGVGVRTARRSTHGTRWGNWGIHIAQGYLAGIPWSGILYFLLTRQSGDWVWHLAFKREMRLGYQEPYQRCGCKRCIRKRSAAAEAAF